MKHMITKLERLEKDLRAMQGHLQEQEWPARSISLTANDLNTWLGMAASTTETLKGVLRNLEETKAEVKEIIEEEKGGKVPSEPVSEPPDGEASDQVPTPESRDQEPESD